MRMLINLFGKDIFLVDCGEHEISMQGGKEGVDDLFEVIL